MTREMKPGEWLWMSGSEKFFLIESGEAELYIVSENDSPDSQGGGNISRKFLQVSATGDMLFALPTGSPLKLLAIFTQAATLREMSVGEVVSSSIKEKAAWLESMLPVLACRPSGRLMPRVFRKIKIGEEENFKAGTKLALPQKQRLAWLKVSREAVEENAKFLTGSELMPLLSAECVELKFDAAVTAFDTETVIEKYGDEISMSAVLSESRRFIRAWEDHFQREEEEYQKDVSDIARQKEILKENSWRELFKSVAPSFGFIKKNIDKSQPATVHALREIAGYFGIDQSRVNLQEGAKFQGDGELIPAALGASGLHAREILPEAGWHRRDMGPMLMFRESKPFAVIPKSPTSYEYIDVDEGKKFPVTDEEAGKFSPRAYMFYEEMPEGCDTLWKWLKWMTRLCWRRDCWLILFCCMVAGLIPVITPLATQTVFADIIPSYDKSALLIVMQVILVTSVSNSLTQLVRGITVLRVKNHLRVAAESALWIKLLALPANFFRRYQVGDLSQRMQGVNALSGQLSSAAVSGLLNEIFCFWNLLLMFYYSYQMAALALVIWSAFFALSTFFSWRKVKFQRKKTEASGKVSGQVLQLLSGLNKFRLRAAEERAFFLWTKKFGVEWQWNRKSRWQDNWIDLVNQAQPIVMNFCIFYYAMTLFDAGQKSGAEFMSQATFLSFNSAMGSFGGSLTSLRSGIVSLWATMPVIERLKPILTAKTESQDGRPAAGELSGEIEVSRVNFRYRENSPLVLKNISFSIKPGTFLAIVGSSGGGKSTLLRVMIGLESPEAGGVFYDGQELAQMNATSVRRQIGVVMQHGQLMSGSIFSNIVGSLPLTQEDAWEAARMVGLADDIREMPMGMMTPVSEGGATFSGGQRQRLLIARSLVSRPRIVVFDEATSALDNETQAIVSETLDNLKATRIIVAHRLSTIKNADRILVMNRGEIAEDGTYDELMARGGLFAELARRQLV